MANFGEVFIVEFERSGHWFKHWCRVVEREALPHPKAFFNALYSMLNTSNLFGGMHVSTKILRGAI
jgi:hypothetical protein